MHCRLFYQYAPVGRQKNEFPQWDWGDQRGPRTANTFKRPFLLADYQSATPCSGLLLNNLKHWNDFKASDKPGHFLNRYRKCAVFQCIWAHLAVPGTCICLQMCRLRKLRETTWFWSFWIFSQPRNITQEIQEVSKKEAGEQTCTKLYKIKLF